MSETANGEMTRGQWAAKAAEDLETNKFENRKAWRKAHPDNKVNNDEIANARKLYKKHLAIWEKLKGGLSLDDGLKEAGLPPMKPINRGAGKAKSAQPAPSKAVAVQGGEGADRFIAQLDQAQTALAQADNDFDRLKVRDGAQAAMAAAAVIERQDIVVRFSAIYMKAERAIVQANEPRQGKRSDLNLSNGFDKSEGSPLSKQVISLMRNAQPEDDALFDQILAQAVKDGRPLTRAELRRAKDEASRLEKLNGTNPDLAQKVRDNEMSIGDAEKLAEIRRTAPNLADRVKRKEITLAEAWKEHKKPSTDVRLTTGTPSGGENPIVKAPTREALKKTDAGSLEEWRELADRQALRVRELEAALRELDAGDKAEEIQQKVDALSIEEIRRELSTGNGQAA